MDDHVSDIETEKHDFNYGFPLIVHNTDRFVLSVNTEYIIRDLKNLKDIFDFTNLDESHEIFSNENKKVNGNFILETPKNIWRDEFFVLRSKVDSFKGKDDN